MQSFDKSADSKTEIESYHACIVKRDGTYQQKNEHLQAEHTLDVYIDGQLSMRMVCSPSHLVELVSGRLLTEGIVADASDIEFVYLCEYGTVARVLLKKKIALEHTNVDAVPSCCTGNKIFAAIEQLGRTYQPVTPRIWQPNWIFSVADIFAADTPMHKKTFGAHSCYLVKNDRILYVCEDLSRHNAFDKVVGCAMRDGVDVKECFIYTSGRVPIDMASKAIRAGIPLLMSKAVPTDLTVELAKRYQLTLLCAAHPDSFTVYNDPLHIIEH